MSRSRKITELEQFDSASQDDLLILEKIGANTSTTGSISVVDLFASVTIPVGNTPTSSNGTFIPNKIWHDGSYIYIAVNSNTLKRVQLQSF